MRASTAVALMCAAAALIAQSRTTISLEILSDGGCSIAVRGAGARSEMSYRPRVPGRCPIPSIREAGRVQLEVLLPRGAAIPHRSEPAMQWSMTGDRPRGVADLAAAPEFVDIMPPERATRRRSSIIIVVLVIAAAAAWAFVRGRVR